MIVATSSPTQARSCRTMPRPEPINGSLAGQSVSFPAPIRMYPEPKPYLPQNEQMVRTVRSSLNTQYTRNDLYRGDGAPPNWISWTSAAPYAKERGQTAWCRHFHTDTRGIVTGTSVGPAPTNIGSNFYIHQGSPSLPVRHKLLLAEARPNHSSVTAIPLPIRTIYPRDELRRLPGKTRIGATVRSSPPTIAMSRQPQISSNFANMETAIHSHHNFSFSAPAARSSYDHGLSVPNTTSTSHKSNATKRVLSPRDQHQQQIPPPPPLFKKVKGFDKLDLLCTATLEIGELHDNPTGCSCPKSKCVALYCDCFKAGRRCHPNRCSCLSCKNTIAESGVDGARTKAIRTILARNPRAFNTAGMGNPLHKLPPGEVACNCVRSRCLKLYCSCFHNGKVCKPDICTCVGCCNTDADDEGHRHAAIQTVMEKRADAFTVKPKVIGQGCACKNNRCLRKYCECFRTGLLCSDKCTCRECENLNQVGNNSEM
jgi:Tesmin/TSO1-like CXC domain, cysteine-rich domain